jgi:hypothetical protein
MNVETGTETPIFLFWEYLFLNFGILSLQCTDSDESCNCRKFSPFLDTKRIGNTYERTYGIRISLWILCSSMFVYLAVASSIHAAVLRKRPGPIKQQLAAGTNQAAVISIRIIPGPRPENPPRGMARKEKTLE